MSKILLNIVLKIQMNTTLNISYSHFLSSRQTHKKTPDRLGNKFGTIFINPFKPLELAGNWWLVGLVAVTPL